LDKEIAQSDEFTYPYYEFCGTKGNFVRVYLSVIKDSIITKEELAEAFIRFGKIINRLDIKDWQQQWKERCDIIKQMRLDSENFQKDSLYMENFINEGFYAYSHSRIYYNTYNLRYIIHRDIFFEEMFLKILQKSKK